MGHASTMFLCRHVPLAAKRHSPSALTVAASVLLTLVASACSREPPRATRRPSGSRAHHTVIGKAPPTAGGYPSVIILEPLVPGNVPVPTTPQVLDQSGIAFYPKVLLARVGQPVQFHNSEDVLHNVRVVDTGTGVTEFNVATPLFGSYDYVFERAGAYAVSCDVHPGMAAIILVTSTPYAVVADDDGSFSFSDVPPGSYHLTVRTGGRRIERTVDIEGPRTTLVLDVS